MLKLIRNVLRTFATLVIALVVQNVAGQWNLWQNVGIQNHGDMAGIGDVLFINNDSDVRRSTDGGATWVAVDPWTNGVYSLYAFDGRLFAGTNTGLFYSDDLGDTWNPTTGIPTGMSPDRYVHRMRKLNGILFAVVLGAGNSGLHKSLDGGLTWTFIPLSTTSVQNIAEHNGVIFVSERYTARPSLDNGITWSSLFPVGTFGNGGLEVFGDRLVVLRAGTLISYSDDDGETWDQGTFPYVLDPGSQQKVDWAMMDGYLYTNAEKKIARSLDGIVWEAYYGGIPSANRMNRLTLIDNTLYGSDLNLTFTLQSTVGLDENTDGTMQAWPNPSMGPLNVALPNSWNSGAQYELHDVLGALVSDGRTFNSSFTIEHPAAAGMYVLSLYSGSKQRKARVVFD